MGITGLIPFIEKASKRVNVSEFSGCTVAIDSYCWLHKGAFACADKLVRGEETDMHIRYCLKYVTMLLSKNIKPILVFDGRHLPAKAMTELKRRESRDISKKRAAELLSLGKVEEARSYMRRSVDITHKMALALIQECRKRNVDCIVAPYEADAQLAYLNIKGFAHLVITEDSDLILFGCTKVLFKMDLEGSGTLVETAKLPLVMKCPIEHYSFDKFRQMCIMSGCDYLASLPGIGLAKARQFVTATQDSNFANALKKLPSFFNKSNLVVTDEYRESFLKAEATFRHQYVYDPLHREMVRLTEPDNEEVEQALCVNAGELLEPDIAFQLALGNLDPFTLKKMDDWHPDHRSNKNEPVKTNGWKDKGICPHPSIWSSDIKPHLDEPTPWQKKIKKLEPIIAVPTIRKKKVVNLVSKYVPESQDESLSIETLSNMYCTEPANKKQKTDCDNTDTLTQYSQGPHDVAIIEEKSNHTNNERSPILENKERSFKKCLRSGNHNILKRLSRFPRTIVDNNVVESKFFSSTEESNVNNVSKDSITIEESPEKNNRNPFKVTPTDCNNDTVCEDLDNSMLKRKGLEDSPENIKRNPFKVTSKDSINEDDTDCEDLDNSQKENSSCNSPLKRKSPILQPIPKVRTLRMNSDVDCVYVNDKDSQESVIENTYPMETLVTPVDSQESFGTSPIKLKPKSIWTSNLAQSPGQNKLSSNSNGFKKSNKISALKKSPTLPSNQPTLLSKFGFQKKPALKR